MFIWNKPIQILICLGEIFILLFACTHTNPKPPKLRIAASANMQFAIKGLMDEFTNRTHIETELITASSGKLTAQIQEGAPFDVFLSADMKYPTALYENGFTHSKPVSYAYGQLVLWTMNQTIPLSLDSFSIGSIKHIALANPKTAPYGLAAKEVLVKKKSWSSIKDKLVFGESIAQTNQFVVTQSAEIGFTAKSVVLSSNLKDKGRWVAIDSNLYGDIVQGFVIVKHPQTPLLQAKQFQSFLFSKEAQKILKDFGYLTLE